MLKHIVMYKLKNDSEQNRNALKDKFLSMKGRIECLLDIDSGVDVINSERAFNVVLVCTFKDLNALNCYLEHPFHIEVRDYVRGVVEKAHSVDYYYN